jgi:conjugative relaxase-like TrwC/TraI family protein
MLNVVAQRNAAAAKAYFAKSDYYSDGQELVGEWGGKGAVLLGLFGKVDKRAFDALCDNINPATNEQLTPITRGDRRTGYDFTWSAPKSVSLVHALTGDARIAQKFRASIRETMEEMEQEMQARVRKKGSQEDRTTGNMLWAEFVHLTSRPVGGLPCPQLHAHCFTLNGTYDPIEGQWKAGQFGKIKGDGYYWQAVQQARFARRLQGLGYAIRPTKDAFEIAGVSDSLIRKFSLRTGVIERVAAERGIIDPKAKAKLGATTREAKDHSVPYEELTSLWDRQLTAEERDALRAAGKSPQRHTSRDAAHVRYAAEHVFERASVISERRLLTSALRHGIGEVTPEAVRTETSRLPLLKRERAGSMWVTTPEVLAEENRMLGFAVSGKGTCKPFMSKGGSDSVSLSPSTLSGEQRAAVAHILSSPDRVMILRGVAGAGKTTLTREAVRQIELGGRRVVMLAPSAQASRGVLRDEGFAAADTLARFIIDPKMQAEAKDGVIWLDEAGLVGTPTMANLFALAEKISARVVLAGDRRQMGSVERGSALRVLEEVGGLKLAEVTDIRRQSGRYKEAVRALSRGATGDGLSMLDEMGWLKVMPAVDSYAPLAADYVDKLIHSRDREKGVLIVSPTHAEGQKIVIEVRKGLREAGVLRGQERELPRLIPLQWTEAERGDWGRYSGDEILQFHRNCGRLKAGERRAYSELPKKQAPAPSAFSAYAQGSIAISPGETIRITANGKTKDGAHKLNNGAVYTVRRFDRAGDIELANGWVVDRNFGHIAHGYVSTVHAAQGRTVDHVLIAQSSMSYAAASREGFYVAVSRGRKSATIYTDDRGELKAAIARSDPRLSATELSAVPKPTVWRRMRDRAVRIRLAALMNARALAPEAERKHKDLAYAR